ncbi:MAG: hypothetical protein KAG94_00695 [Clostridiales bacterium]|nr:hypothetical protein [Clostridiales bacterium]
MKKVISIIFIFSLLAGCSVKTGDILPGISSEVPSISQDITQITDKEIEEIAIYMESSGKPYTNIPSWELYIEELTGVTLHIEYVKTIEAITKPETPIIGAIYNQLNNLAYYIIDNTELNPLNKYYELYNWYQYIDQASIDLLTKGDDILALPCQSQPFIRARYYNKEILDKANLPVPATVNEFTTFLQFAKGAKPDNYPMVISSQSVTRQLSDIFRANDVYINTFENSTIAYNPKTQSIEDGVFAPNFHDAYSYIRYLQENQLLHFDKINPINPIWSYPLATEYSVIYSKNYSYKDYDRSTPDFDYEVGYYLEGSNHEKLVEVRTINNYYYFPKSIKNIDRYMELFNEVISKNNYYLDLYFGMRDNDYFIEDQQIILSDNKRKIYTSLSTIEPNHYEQLNDVEGLSYLNTIPQELYYQNNSLLDIIPLSFGSGYSIFHYPPTQFGGRYNVSKVTALFDRRLDELSYVGLAPIDEVIKEYKSQFMKAQIGEYINKLNERIGASTVYDYEFSE